MNTPRQTIFDIGAHRGDDTHIYLSQGFNVVAVEANPSLIFEMLERFAYEIASGQLIIINAAVYNVEEENISFYIASDDSKSSIQLQSSKDKIIVPTTQLKTLINKYGTPVYCKIDIENADSIALDSLDKLNLPDYISVELSGENISFLSSNENSIHLTVNKLESLGYRKFKLVDQEDLIELRETSHYPKKRKLVFKIINKVINRLGKSIRLKTLKKFNLGMNSEISGPIPQYLEGEWYSHAEIKKIIIYHFKEYEAMTLDKKLIFWVDVYAKL